MGIKSSNRKRCTIRDYETEIDSWKEFASQQSRNVEYYRGLLDEIGVLVGEEAYRTDDNEIVTEVLKAKLPELVEKLIRNTNKEG